MINATIAGLTDAIDVLAKRVVRTSEHAQQAQQSAEADPNDDVAAYNAWQAAKVAALHAKELADACQRRIDEIDAALERKATQHSH